MDVTTAKEAAAALVVLGTTGLLSMTTYRLALKSCGVHLLPAATASRVRWWSGHLGLAAAVSGCLLVVGLVGLLLL